MQHETHRLEMGLLVIPMHGSSWLKMILTTLSVARPDHMLKQDLLQPKRQTIPFLQMLQMTIWKAV